MANQKSVLYRALKEVGYVFEKPYVAYTADELRALSDAAGVAPVAPRPSDEPIPDLLSLPDDEPVAPAPTQPRPAPSQPEQQALELPRSDKPDTLAGTRTGTHGRDDPIRVDSSGRVWYQDEVLKSAVPRPRHRRVIQYQDPGVARKQVRGEDGAFETVEIAGQQNRTREVKVTLPTWQTGIYADPRFPFRIHTYNGRRAFDFGDVNDFYGGSDLVPSTIKRTYVATDLCYDIRTVIQTIQAEDRRLTSTNILQQKG